MKNFNLKGILSSRSLLLASLLTVAVFVSSCSKEEDTVVSNENVELKAAKAVKKGDLSIAQIALANDGEFDELVSALVYVDTELNAGLVDLFLNGKDQYTVFAPTDAAFEKLYGVLGVSSITEVDPQTVLNVLLYHVVDGRRAANSVVPSQNSKTIETLLSGATFSVDSSAKIWAVGNSATIVKANISASNGIIHVIDTVLLPISL